MFCPNGTNLQNCSIPSSHPVKSFAFTKMPVPYQGPQVFIYSSPARPSSPSLVYCAQSNILTSLLLQKHATLFLRWACIHAALLFPPPLCVAGSFVTFRLSPNVIYSELAPLIPGQSLPYLLVSFSSYHLPLPENVLLGSLFICFLPVYLMRT